MCTDLVLVILENIMGPRKGELKRPTRSNSSGANLKSHRFGRSVAGRPRPIIVKCIRHSVRARVLKSANKLKHHHEKVYINEDLPALIKTRRAELRAVVRHANAEGVAAKQSGDKITVGGQTYDHRTLDCLPAKLPLESACMKPIGNDNIGFHSKHSPLSNFHPCTLVMENVAYNSTEQAFQACKARFNDRDDIAKKIMAQSDCVPIMRLGNMIKPQRDSPWFDQREQIMKSALLAKFTQNDHLRLKLEATGACG